MVLLAANKLFAIFIPVLTTIVITLVIIISKSKSDNGDD